MFASGEHLEPLGRIDRSVPAALGVAGTAASMIALVAQGFDVGEILHPARGSLVATEVVGGR